MVGNTIRGMGIPSVVMQNGTTLGTWEISQPGVGAVMEFYSTKPPEEVSADLAKGFANPKIASEPDATQISGPLYGEFGNGTTSHWLEGNVTFSVGVADIDPDQGGPQPSEAIQTVIGAQYFVNTRSLAGNTGVAEIAAHRLEGFVFEVTEPLDLQGTTMELPSLVAARGQGRTPLDESETLETMFR